MHIYIYDEFVNSNKYENLLARIETRITDLGLNGKIIRLGAMKDALSAVDNEITRGAKTLTAVGNNNTVNKIVKGLILSGLRHDCFFDIPIGIIPVGKENNDIAEIFGMPFEEDACDILSARRIKTIDVGQANQEYFIWQAKIQSQATYIDVENNFSLEVMEPGSIIINNLQSKKKLEHDIASTPDDGVLELFIETGSEKNFFKKTASSQSFFSVKKLMIASDQNELILDGVKTIKTPVEISVLKKKINVIIEKGREL